MLLRQLLYRCEPRFLSVIASFWLNLQSTPNYEELIRMLCERMMDAVFLSKKLMSPDSQELLPPLQRLLSNRGVMTSESFESAFGIFRIAGADKMFREKMWMNPISLTEKLWYRGLIFRETRIIQDELKDCFVLPEDMQKTLSGIIQNQTPDVSQINTLAVRPAIPSETTFVNLPDNSLPDIFSIALAFQRDGRKFDFPGLDVPNSYLSLLRMLVSEGSFFDSSDSPNTESIRNFLIQNRTAARICLIKIWRDTQKYDELSESPEISVIHKPNYIVSNPREKILDILSALPTDTWISVNGFISSVKKTYSQFLRGTFSENRWQLQDLEGNDLSGISSWFQLEGAYLRFLLAGPLNWLGLIQCAFSDKTQKNLTAFRVTQETLFYLSESAQTEISEKILSKPNLEQDRPAISADGVIDCSVKVSRYFRYMAARYTEAEKINRDRVILRITPASLSNAERIGLPRTALLTLLQRFSKNKVPPTLERMLSSTGNTSHTAMIYSATILTIPDPMIMEELLNTSRIEKWVLQQITSSVVLIDTKGINEIRRFLMEREMFVDVNL